MKTAYVQISPISVSYANIIHLQQAVKLSGAKRFFLCVWDQVAFEDPAFFSRPRGARSAQEHVQEIALVHRSILSSMGVEVHMVFLSEAWSRLFSKPALARVFNAILSKTRLSEVVSRPGLPGEDLTFSRINYTIADFLIAANFHKLFPEISAAGPSDFVTSRRLTPFLPSIHAVLGAHRDQMRLPRIVWVSPFAFFRDRDGAVPSMEMGPARVGQVVAGAFAQRPFSDEELSRIRILLGVGKGDGAKAGRGVRSPCEAIAEDLHRFLVRVRRSLDRPSAIEGRLVRVTDPDQFHREVHPLSAVKLKILSLCDGTRTSFHIAKELGLKQVTVSVYLGRLRAIGLITDNRRPDRKVSSLVVDLDAMAARKGGVRMDRGGA